MEHHHNALEPIAGAGAPGRSILLSPSRWIDFKGGNCCGADCDEIFTYDTPKVTRIQDARLGLSYYAVVLVTFLYIVIYQMWYKMAYLDMQLPTMDIRLSLRQPTVNMCNPSNSSCQDQYPDPTNPAFQSYCCHSGCTNNTDNSCTCPGSSFLQYQCAFFDGAEASQVQQSTVMVATYIQATEQVKNPACGSGSGVCTKLWRGNGQPVKNYVAGIEDFVITSEFAVAQTELDIFATAKQMVSYINVSGTGPLSQALCAKNPSQSFSSYYGGAPKPSAPCYIKPSNDGQGTDLITLQDVLSSMELNLDTAMPGTTKPLRYEGFTVTVNLQFYNSYPGKGTFLPIVAVYTFTATIDNPLQVNPLVWNGPATDYRQSRVQRSLHGILFSFSANGQLGKLNFQELLTTLTTSLTLLFAGGAVVKYMAIYILKNNIYYQELIFHRTADFSDVHLVEGCTDAQINEALTKLTLPTTGTRVQRILRLLEHRFVKETEADIQMTTRQLNEMQRGHSELLLTGHTSDEF